MERRCLLVVLIGGIFTSQPSCTTKVKQVNFSTAKAAYSKYDFGTALRGFIPAAQQGNSDAQSLLGKMYEKGEGVPQNYSESLKWYRLVAQRQDAGAEYSIGKFYDEGHGVPKDTAEAVKWFRLASEHGNGEASFTLGDKYYRGTGVAIDRYKAVTLGVLSAKQGELFGCFLAEGAYNPKEDQPKEASEYVRWLKFGAKNGVATAQVALGMKYYFADGVPRNYSEAVRLFMFAAIQDGMCAKSNISVLLAQSLLGDIYESGRGVTVDYVEAAKWRRMAADGGYEDAQYRMGSASVRGVGVPQDYSEGVRYYRLAAEQGHKKAQGALGAMYSMGKGVPQDYVQAHLWINLAS
jgi:TPR repeat protein